MNLEVKFKLIELRGPKTREDYELLWAKEKGFITETSFLILPGNTPPFLPTSPPLFLFISL